MPFYGDSFYRLYGHAGLGGQGHGNGQQGNQGFEFAGLPQVCCLQVKPSCLEIGKQGFNRPAVPVEGESLFGTGRTGERQQCPGRKPLDDKPYRRAVFETVFSPQGHGLAPCQPDRYF